MKLLPDELFQIAFSIFVAGVGGAVKYLRQIQTDINSFSVIQLLITVFIGGVLGSIVGGLGGGALDEWAGGKVGSIFNDDEDESQQAKATEPNTPNRLSNWLGDQLPNWMSEDKTAQPIANASPNGPASQSACITAK